MYKIGSWVRYSPTGMYGTIDDIDLLYGIAFSNLRHANYQGSTKMWVKLNDLEVIPVPDN